jgi:hypothetical protein
LPNTQVKCLDIITTAAEASIRERLRLDNTEPITVIRRVVTLDTSPISYVVSFISRGLGARIAKKSVERHPLAWLLTNRLGITIRTAVQTVEPVVADIDTARYLEVPVGAPLLLVERDFLDRRDKPIFHTRQFFRGDRYKFATSLQWKRSAPRVQNERRLEANESLGLFIERSHRPRYGRRSRHRPGHRTGARRCRGSGRRHRRQRAGRCERL